MRPVEVSRQMISGIVELMSPRRAIGWAYEADDLTAPLILRARYQDTVMAEFQQNPVTWRDQTFPAGQPYRAHRFNLEFPRALEHRYTREMVVEATHVGTDKWGLLSRTLRVGPALFEFEVAPERDLRFKMNRVERTNPGTEFWTSVDDLGVGASPDSHPVFILGAARSGTTAIANGLAKGTRYRGFSEGHVLDLAIRFAHGVNEHFELKDRWIQPGTASGYHLGQLGYDRLRNEVISMLRRLAGGFNTPFWFDKTPTYQMIASVPILADMWPNARFIFMKRRGLENIASRIRKFAGVNFDGKCRDWNIIMSSWRSVRGILPGRHIELDQREMAENPEEAAKSVGRLLGLDPSEVESLAGVLRTEQPESTGAAASIVSDVSELGWSQSQIDVFRETCGVEMEAYGYTYDARYSVHPGT